MSKEIKNIQDGSTYPAPSDDLRAEIKERYKGASIKDLAVAFKELKELHETLKADAARIYHEWNYVRFALVPELDDMGVINMKFTGIGRVEQRHDLSCKQLSPTGLITWMENNGHEDMVSEVVNSSSLKSFLKQQIANGEELPPDDVVKVTPFSYGTVVKA